METVKTKNETIDIVILVNGPGELASYARPTIAALNEHNTPKRITIIFTPCPYSTGKEVGIARSLKGVDHVVTADEFVKWVLWQSPPKIDFGAKGVVVFLGGDVLYGKMITKKLKYPAIAYTEAFAKWPKIYKKYLVPDEIIKNKFIKQGFPAAQIDVIGNLMVDSISPHMDHNDAVIRFGLDGEKKLVSFLPGSREFIVQCTFKLYFKIAKELKAKDNDLQFSYIISPYLQEAILEKYLNKSGFIRHGNSIEKDGIKIILITSDQHEAIKASDLIITIPGTNTAEVAIIGTPMIVIFPLDTSEMIPLEGIYEIAGKLPILGYFLKKTYVKIVQSKVRFFAIPNIKNNAEIVPELKGHIDEKDVANKAYALLSDENALKEIRSKLVGSLGVRGASNKLAEEIVRAS